MAVEQNVWAARFRAANLRTIMRDHHRMTFGRAYIGFEAERREFVREPIGGLAALAAIGGIGGNARDAQ